MKKQRDVSFYVLLAGILLVAVSLFIVWRNYKKKYTVSEPEPEADQEPDPGPGLAPTPGADRTEPAKDVRPAPEPGSNTPPFVTDNAHPNE